MDSLAKYPESHRFTLGSCGVQIRGGNRAKEDENDQKNKYKGKPGLYGAKKNGNPPGGTPRPKDKDKDKDKGGNKNEKKKTENTRGPQPNSSKQGGTETSFWPNSTRTAIKTTNFVKNDAQ